MGRKIARESTMKIFYQMDLLEDYTEEIISKFTDDENLNDEEHLYLSDIIKGFSENRDEIDAIISKYSQGWKIERISKIDLAVMRIALTEIIYRKDIPLQVSINEALEICKKYSSEESSKFINGILGTYVRENCIDEK